MSTVYSSIVKTQLIIAKYSSLLGLILANFNKVQFNPGYNDWTYIIMA